MTDKKAKLKFQSPRGMHDLLPEDAMYYEYITNAFQGIVESHGYQRMETPIVESREIFEKGLGDSSDVIGKEMFGLIKKSGEDLVLRPEHTGGKARAYVENGMASRPQPLKLYSIGPVFRYERPQAGRLRQFIQLDTDVFGNSRPATDAEIIQIHYRVLERLGISQDLLVQINSIGCKECRGEYLKVLRDYFRGTKNKMCADCKKRYAKNTLRLLDCKEEKCKNLASKAPQSVDHLCEDCKKHFKGLLEILDELNIPYILNHTLVRGLDYYSRTVFEIYASETASFPLKTSIVAGGRYDNLVKIYGGVATSAVGCSMGFERVMQLMKDKKIEVPRAKGRRVFLAQLGELAKRKSMKLFEHLYANGVHVLESFGRDSIKSQLKLAEKLGVDVVLILGQKEAVEDTILIRDMRSGIQEEIPQDNIIRSLQKKLEEIDSLKIDHIKIPKKKEIVELPLKKNAKKRK